MQRSLLTAILKTSSGQASIDVAAGVIQGVKLMELGKLASFSDENGRLKSVTITDAHISALLNHAGNRAIPIHLTHDWFSAQGKDNADTVEMAARIGALKAFRKDSAGNLIADAYLKDGQARQDILWGAQHNPEDNCFSVVFSYLKDDPQCIPQNFRAGDIVPAGAATTALFSKTTNEPMEPKEFIALLLTALADKSVQTALLSHMPAAPKEPDEAEVTKMEVESGVTDEDKVATDAQQPALMRAQLRIGRAIRRQAKSLEASKTAILAEAKIQAAAEATALLGKGGYLKAGDLNQTGDATAKFNSAVKELTDKGVKLHIATQTVIDHQPKLYSEMNQALFKAPVAA